MKDLNKNKEKNFEEEVIDQTSSNNHKQNQSTDKFRFGVLPIDPLFVWITLIYGFTRIFELFAGKERLWEKFWVKIVELSGDNEHNFVVWTTSWVFFVLYWVMSLIFLYWDLTGKMKRYKIIEGTNEPLDLKKSMKGALMVLFNQLVVSLSFSSMVYWLSFFVHGDRDLKAVPSFWILMRDLLISHTLFDIIFFAIHRLMHTKYLYKKIHKVHHEWKAPVALVSIYCHPTEHFITNMFPSVAGPTLMTSHYCTIWIWLATVAISTMTDHSGLMDFLFKTDVKYRKSIYFKRHRVLMSLKSTIRELYPSCKRENNRDENVYEASCQLNSQQLKTQ